ncbi:MAG: response regulator [Gammaproteobacteria bacterium]
MAPAEVNPPAAVNPVERAEPRARRPVRVLIVDDHALVRYGIGMLLRQEPGLEVCGEAEDALDARRRIDALEPDIVIVDLVLKESNGLDLIKWIRKQHPRTKTIVSTMHDERVYGGRALRAGASGFVSKQAESRAICSAVRAVLKGRLYFSQDSLQRILERAQTRDTPIDRSPIEGLSDRELEVFRLMGTGRTTREIASLLHLSPSTVDTYRGRLRHKLQVENTNELHVEATRWVLEQGIP